MGTGEVGREACWEDGVVRVVRIDDEVWTRMMDLKFGATGLIQVTSCSMESGT